MHTHSYSMRGAIVMINVGLALAHTNTCKPNPKELLLSVFTITWK